MTRKPLQKARGAAARGRVKSAKGQRIVRRVRKPGTEQAPVNQGQSLLNGGFHIINNVFDVAVPLPLDLGPDLRIERPNDAQIETIHFLLGLSSMAATLREAFEFEHEATYDENGRITGWTNEPLARPDWRYLILTFAGNGNSAYFFLSAANLVSPAISSFAHAYTREPFGTGRRAGCGVDELGAHRRFFATAGQRHLRETLDAGAVARVTAVYKAFQAFDGQRHPGIRRAIELFGSFPRLPNLNFVRVLALFMLLEMLLTHNPGDKEIGDSLSHQLRTKIPFVESRLPEKLDYSCFTGGAAPDAIWSKLYSYRSAIAHGDEPDFASKLQVLKNAETADEFLERVTRRLLRHAIDDPLLFDGLKQI
jgi:hypothetical protein